MKNKTTTIIAIIACALLIFDSFKIMRMQNEIDNLRSNLNNETNAVSREISSIYANVQDMLDKEASQLSSAEWEYGNIDVEQRTAEIKCRVVPKVYNPESTKATIVCDGLEYDMQYENNQYVATIELPLFGKNEFSQVKLNDNGTIRTEELNWILEPRYEVLPLSYAGMGGKATGKPGNGEYVWSPQYSVHINIEGKAIDYQIKSIDFVEVLDGKESSRTPIDLSQAGQKSYVEALEKSNQPVPEYAAQSTNANYHESVQFLYYLDKEYHIKNGSMLEFYIDVVDGYGLRYRSFVDCMATKDNQPDEERMEQKAGYIFAEPVIIFDEAGNRIFELEPGLF